MDFIDLLPSDLQQNMRDLWSGCPAEIRQTVSIVEVPKGARFITAGQECANVYVLLKGTACGIDMQFTGTEYRFKEFTAGRFLGDYECHAGLSEYVITVQANTPCVLCALAARQYLLWMKGDVHALFLRTHEIIRNYTIQTQNDRRFFLSPCRERMIQVFAKWYEEAGQKELSLKQTREQLSNTMGFVVRTIDRNINKLANEGYITLQAGRIHINYEQYLRMKQFIKQNFAY